MSQRHWSRYLVNPGHGWLRLQARLRRLVGRQPRPTAATLLRRSPLFNATWYREHYQVTGDPVQHYLTEGARLGYAPSPQFDPVFYLSTYPDVAERKLNPLVHYLRYGQYEGRQPKSNQVAEAYHRLWGGQSQTALEQLDQLATDQAQTLADRYRAHWEMARWYSFCAEHARALEQAEYMAALQPAGRQSPEWLLLVAHCRRALGQAKAARPSLQAYVEQHPQATDIWFALANTYAGQERLGYLNRGLQAHQLAPLTLSDPSQPLSLANLTTQSAAMLCQAGLPAGAQAAMGNTSPPTPLVSVIIPAYNAADTLPVALRSLLAQDYTNLEILVVDDASTDNTAAVVAGVSRQDARVKLLQQARNQGAYAARNRGLKAARGNLITTHDSDDWSHPAKIKLQVQALQANLDWQGVATYWVRARHDLTITQNWRPSAYLTHWSQSSFLFRARVVAAIGPWDEVRVGGDTEFIRRVQQYYGKASVQKIHPQAPLAIALDDASSLTRTKATHVRTVYFGLRHLYHELAGFWHRQQQQPHLTPAARPFPLPHGMQRGAGVLRCDMLLAGDLRDDGQVAALGELLEQRARAGCTLALLHWPSARCTARPLRDRILAAVIAHQVTMVTHGDKVDTDLVVLAQANLLTQPPDALPQITFATARVLDHDQGHNQTQKVRKADSGDQQQHAVPVNEQAVTQQLQQLCNTDN